MNRLMKIVIRAVQHDNKPQAAQIWANLVWVTARLRRRHGSFEHKLCQ
jgi:hypothetical protein